jgi:hypothetical protein
MMYGRPKTREKELATKVLDEVVAALVV